MITQNLILFIRAPPSSQVTEKHQESSVINFAKSLIFPSSLLLMICYHLGPGAVGCHPRSVYGRWRRCQRGHQPHSETTQEGGAFISGPLLAVETRGTHNTPLLNFTIQCLISRTWRSCNSKTKHATKAVWVGLLQMWTFWGCFLYLNKLNNPLLSHVWS